MKKLSNEKQGSDSWDSDQNDLDNDIEQLTRANRLLGNGCFSVVLFFFIVFVPVALMLTHLE
ncbi:MAG: hypothetical protein LBU61_01845 [Coriobacteriales bacterium]|jgi:hypothetical protein|nr:hypothetical protein [Coriobacteriales bacterium]